MDRIHSLTPSHRTLTRCLVCGSSEVRTDQVIDLGLVLLSECGRCQHRSTRGPALAPARVGHAEEVSAA